MNCYVPEKFGILVWNLKLNLAVISKVENSVIYSQFQSQPLRRSRKWEDVTSKIDLAVPKIRIGFRRKRGLVHTSINSFLSKMIRIILIILLLIIIFILIITLIIILMVIFSRHFSDTSNMYDASRRLDLKDVLTRPHWRRFKKMEGLSKDWKVFKTKILAKFIILREKNWTNLWCQLNPEKRTNFK